ncbi:hypothetical protein ACSNN7_14605 [Micromonospora sp. URMC 105]
MARRLERIELVGWCEPSLAASSGSSWSAGATLDAAVPVPGRHLRR